MVTEQRKPSPWYWWTLTAFVFPVAYPLSLGPVAWGLEKFELDDPYLVGSLQFLYAPVNQVAESSPSLFLDAYKAYVDWWLN